MIHENYNVSRSIFMLSIEIALIGAIAGGCADRADRSERQQSTSSIGRTENVRSVENNQTTKIVGNNRDARLSDRTSITTNDGMETQTETSTENTTTDRHNSSPTKIADGRYWVGATDQALEVRGDRYRYDSEGGEQPWQSISTLKFVNSGVVFDGKTYWCSSALAPDPPTGCSANGWSR